jgi:hypothetical protein
VAIRTVELAWRSCNWFVSQGKWAFGRCWVPDFDYGLCRLWISAVVLVLLVAIAFVVGFV